MHQLNTCSGGRVACDLLVVAAVSAAVWRCVRSAAFHSLLAVEIVLTMSVALAWLLQRSPNILLIPGTSSVEHLRENVAGAGLQLPHEAVKKLNAIAG
jgi:pyridoxine 4-dehydrogenase